jgi:hypothetical protein
MAKEAETEAFPNVTIEQLEQGDGPKYGRIEITDALLEQATRHVGDLNDQAKRDQSSGLRAGFLSRWRDA